MLHVLTCSVGFALLTLASAIHGARMSKGDDQPRQHCPHQPQRQSLYDYYTAGGIHSGLEANGSQFTLNGKEIRILSGAMHYFRVPRAYWKDRLLKMKAAGLNTVETYVAWNAHERRRSDFDFSDGLDVVAFVETARDVDLFVIFRPGPYICSEWEFGGLPAWLLRDPNMRVRTTYAPFMAAVDDYFAALIPLVAGLQFTAGGGPIIAAQVENEYGTYVLDKAYPVAVMDSLVKHGLRELLFTSDSATDFDAGGSIPGVLVTVNFQTGAAHSLEKLQEYQPDRPLMVMEYWGGWYDHWKEPHSSFPLETFSENLREILEANASVNFYMYHGGTNFGFMSGADSYESEPVYRPTVTSYDYDAPLSENGTPTAKYYRAIELMEELVPGFQHTAGPSPAATAAVESAKSQRSVGSAESSGKDATEAAVAKNSGSRREGSEHDRWSMVEAPTAAEDFERRGDEEDKSDRSYGRVDVRVQMSFEEILARAPSEHHAEPISMELLDCNEGSGQGYGFILYRVTLSPDAGVVTLPGRVRDRAQIWLDGHHIAIIDWSSVDYWFPVAATAANRTLDILVENMGRVNYQYGYDVPDFVRLDSQRKGLVDGVRFDSVQATSDWQIFPLEWDVSFLEALAAPPALVARARPASNSSAATLPRPALFVGHLDAGSSPRDTFLRLDGWGKGVVFVNDFNIGRYWEVGPQEELYVPAPLLRSGSNTIRVFELHHSNTHVMFS
ncbi:PREDICTED: beta-galactosidase-1-like protein 2 [Priapulus caudatus]|uniref:Beta-galactosidase n=1 Tax=Priapulus caudatus TaxID=37621 RepID=A0ABM1DXP2_PRICU|nr:PREDICTED: beta-galactosidase-1-like protein 2 [Priapulus caudatus]